MIKIENLYHNEDEPNIAKSYFHNNRYDDLVEGDVTNREFMIDFDKDNRLSVKLSYQVINDGDKISIEVASNGFIIKANGTTTISKNQYDLEIKIKGLAYTQGEKIVKVDASEFDYADALAKYLESLRDLS